MKKHLKAKVGLAGFIFGFGGFFFFMQFFHIFNSKIQYENPDYMLKVAIPFTCLIISLYSVGYMSGGHKAAIKFAGIWVLLLAFAFTNGYNKHTEELNMNLVNSLQVVIDEAGKEGRSFDPKVDFVDLVFSIKGEPREENGSVWVVAEGMIDDKKVGFEIGISDKTSGVDVDTEGQVTAVRPTPNGITLRSVGEISDNLVQALGGFYNILNPPSKMVQEISLTSVALSNNLSRIRHREVQFKLFNEKKFQEPESVEATEFYANEYFEMYLNFDLQNKRIYLKEKDQGYRSQQIKVLGR